MSYLKRNVFQIKAKDINVKVFNMINYAILNVHLIVQHVIQIRNEY